MCLQDVKFSPIAIYSHEFRRMNCSLNWSCVELHCDPVKIKTMINSSRFFLRQCESLDWGVVPPLVTAFAVGWVWSSGWTQSWIGLLLLTVTDVSTTFAVVFFRVKVLPLTATLRSGKTTVSVLHANLISCRVGFVPGCFYKSNFSSSASLREQPAWQAFEREGEGN